MVENSAITNKINDTKSFFFLVMQQDNLKFYSIRENPKFKIKQTSKTKKPYRKILLYVSMVTIRRAMHDTIANIHFKHPW